MSLPYQKVRSYSDVPFVHAEISANAEIMIHTV